MRGNPLLANPSPLGRPLSTVERLSALAALLHRVILDIQEGRYAKWAGRWKYLRYTREDIALHQMRQELRQLYR